MITAIIFFIHFIFIIIIYTKKWQEEGISQAWMNVGLIIILFAVGWSLTGVISKLLMDQDGFGIQFDRDTFSLTILSILEFFFYRIYYKTPSIEDGKEIQ
jgi:4-hydroxybenzoate polyprenyltransferase